MGVLATPKIAWTDNLILSILSLVIHLISRESTLQFILSTLLRYPVDRKFGQNHSILQACLRWHFWRHFFCIYIFLYCSHTCNVQHVTALKYMFLYSTVYTLATCDCEILQTCCLVANVISGLSALMNRAIWRPTP